MYTVEDRAQIIADCLEITHGMCNIRNDNGKAVFKPDADSTLPYWHSDEHREELMARPLHPDYQVFTEEQLLRRIEIAKHHERADFSIMKESDTPAIPYFEKWPRWKFYHIDKGYGARRIYGIHHALAHDDPDPIFVSITAMTMFNNETVGGINASELIPVRRYPKNTLDVLRKTPTPGLFLDPLGYIVFANVAARDADHNM